MIMKSKDEARKFFEQESEQRQTSNSPPEQQPQKQARARPKFDISEGLKSIKNEHKLPYRD